MSIVLEMKVIKGEKMRRGIAHWWGVMMDYEMSEREFTLDDILAKSDDDRSGCMDFMKRLLKAGFIAEAGCGSYRVMRRQSHTPKVRRDGTVIADVGKHQCMWNLMRGPVGINGFGATDLVMWASTRHQVISLGTARSYINRLAASGYLMWLERGRWRLYPDMNSGCAAPKILRTRAVFDPNRREIVGRVEVEEVGR